MAQLTTTLNELKAHNSCNSSWRKCLTYADEYGIGLDDSITFHQLHEVLGDHDLLWSTRILTKRQQVYIAAKIAQQVSHLTDDKRVHECLAVCFRYAKGDATEKELMNAALSAAEYAESAAEYAAYATWSAAYVASAASARSAAAAARYAAYANVAESAANSALSAADYAAEATWIAEGATWDAALSIKEASYNASAQIVLKFCETGEMI